MNCYAFFFLCHDKTLSHVYLITKWSALGSGMKRRSV